MCSTSDDLEFSCYRPVYNRIPNFKGASRAAANKTEQLPEFRGAKTIKVNPDKPQEEVRFKVRNNFVRKDTYLRNKRK